MPRLKTSEVQVNHFEDQEAESPNGKTPRREAGARGVQPTSDSETTGSPAEIITEAAIARRAYELYDSRGRQDGHHHDDWLQAERELNGGR